MLKYVHNIYKIMVKILDMMDNSSSHPQFFKLTWVIYLTFNPLFPMSGIMNYFENFEWSSELQNNQIQLYIIPVILVDNYCMHCD